MNRVIIYPGQIPLETDLLSTNKNAMLALSKLAAAILGTSTLVNGLACAPTSPASLNVTVGAGEIYVLANIDGSAYSSIAADTTHTILKQGIRLDASDLSCPAPGTVGHSINYLIQATFSEVDNSPVVLPYYNASNPASAYAGPNNNGVAQNTNRAGTVVVSAKAGISATTGTQTTPPPDAGYVGLWVVTVANGATTIVTGNISAYASAPLISETLTQKISLATADGKYATKIGLQSGTYDYAADSGAANAYVVNLSPVPTIAAGLKFRMKAAFPNTGASTVTINGTSINLVRRDGTALKPGDIAVAGSMCDIEYDGTQAQLMNAPLIGVRQAFFVSNSSWLCPAGVTSAVVSMSGGGGGGGGATASSGGGGGGGAEAKSKNTVATVPGTTYTVTIGAGGVAGGPDQTGASGGTTSLGALLSTSGGGGGVRGTSGAAGGASGGGGGAPGGSGGNTAAGVPGGGGGGCTFGAGGLGGATSTTGGVGGGFGAGGGGGNTSAGGGAGTGGFVLIEW